jgi:glutaminyl-peptide cyclotransferase
MKLFSLCSFLFFALQSCNNTSATQTNDDANSTNPVAELKPQYEIVAQYPHNTTSFTEGLEFMDSILLESTGQNGQSNVFKIDPTTGKELQKIALEDKYFGEGITAINNKIFMVTYQTEKGFVFDSKTLKKLKEFSYKGEGWGLTNDGKQIIMSNGSNNLSYRNATTFAEENIKAIFDENGPLGNINELEYADSFVYANIWQTNYIVKIDPSRGKVVNKYDFTSLVNQYIINTPNVDVMNGIAYNKKSKTFFITGKNWPLLFEVKLY